MDLSGIEYVVVGSGLFGAVMAERIAFDLGARVAVLEKRNHLGGNCYSEYSQETGIECHAYGTHIFHTKIERVWEYVNRFSSFNHYRHRVFAHHKSKVYPMPINLDTFNRFFNLKASPDEMRAYIASEIRKDGLRETAANLEQKAISFVGRELYEAFIYGYTKKQWGVEPRGLPAEIIVRLPFRTSYNSDYFSDPWQGLPVDGYTNFLAKILSHKNIQLEMKTDYFAIKNSLPKNCKVIFTGPIDRYFNYKHGKLGWRTLDFVSEVMPTCDFQGTSVMNYVDIDVPYTRVHEFRHLHPERDYPLDSTIICREYPKSVTAGSDEPYYPINSEDDRRIYSLYAHDAQHEVGVFFGGRLGGYQYHDMDRSIDAALTLYQTEIKKVDR